MLYTTRPADAFSGLSFYGAAYNGADYGAASTGRVVAAVVTAGGSEAARRVRTRGGVGQLKRLEAHLAALKLKLKTAKRTGEKRRLKRRIQRTEAEIRTLKARAKRRIGRREEKGKALPKRLARMKSAMKKKDAATTSAKEKADLKVPASVRKHLVSAHKNMVMRRSMGVSFNDALPIVLAKVPKSAQSGVGGWLRRRRAYYDVALSNPAYVEVAKMQAKEVQAPDDLPGMDQTAVPLPPSEAGSPPVAATWTPGAPGYPGGYKVAASAVPEKARVAASEETADEAEPSATDSADESESESDKAEGEDLAGADVPFYKRPALWLLLAAGVGVAVFARKKGRGKGKGKKAKQSAAA